MNQRRPRGEAATTISNGLAHLHMRFFGRGPSEAKTHLLDDLVICVLWNGFTTVERTLLARGERGAVEAFRRTFQATMEEQFTEVVEEATGRRVQAYMSQVHVDPDVAVEIFMLEPEARTPDGARAARLSLPARSAASPASSASRPSPAGS